MFTFDCESQEIILINRGRFHVYFKILLQYHRTLIKE